ncbi:MAG: fibronectin type III domain-containing protein [Velocimicrobium sp.]
MKNGQNLVLGKITRIRILVCVFIVITASLATPASSSVKAANKECMVRTLALETFTEKASNQSVKGADSKKALVKKVLKKVSLTTVDADAKGNVKLKWRKVSSATGYMIYCAQEGKKYKKIATVKKNSTTKYTASDLEAGKSYKFRMRAYKKVNKVYYYGTYSLEKSVKIEKNKEDTIVTGKRKAKIEATGENSIKITLTDPYLKNSYDMNLPNINVNYARCFWRVEFKLKGSDMQFMVMSSIYKDKENETEKGPSDAITGFYYWSDPAPEEICPASLTIDGNDLIWEVTIPSRFFEGYGKITDLSKAKNIEGFFYDYSEEDKLRNR